MELKTKSAKATGTKAEFKAKGDFYDMKQPHFYIYYNGE